MRRRCGTRIFAVVLCVAACGDDGEESLVEDNDQAESVQDAGLSGSSDAAEDLREPGEQGDSGAAETADSGRTSPDGAGTADGGNAEARGDASELETDAGEGAVDAAPEDTGPRVDNAAAWAGDWRDDSGTFLVTVSEDGGTVTLKEAGWTQRVMASRCSYTSTVSQQWLSRNTATIEGSGFVHEMTGSLQGTVTGTFVGEDSLRLEIEAVQEVNAGCPPYERLEVPLSVSATLHPVSS